MLARTAIACKYSLLLPLVPQSLRSRSWDPRSVWFDNLTRLSGMDRNSDGASCRTRTWYLGTLVPSRIPNGWAGGQWRAMRHGDGGIDGSVGLLKSV